MGLNPWLNLLNMPGSMPDMSALEGMMGQEGHADLSAPRRGRNANMSQLFGGGLRGKAGEFLMRRGNKWPNK